MLVALSIRDIVLIDKLDLAFSEGLTVFTGETGAGKSIILDSLSLALGARGDGGLVRSGSLSGSITASFDLIPSHSLNEPLRENDLYDGETLIFRRVQFPDGRTKSFINDRPVSTALQRRLGRLLVEIHGQHDDRALLDTAHHRELLDQFGGLIPQVEAVSGLWRMWRDLLKKADALEERLRAAAREADYLQSACDELDNLAPQEGEEEKLAEARLSLLTSGKLRADLEAAGDALSGRQFPDAKLSAILRRLERQPTLPDSVKQVLAAIDRVLIEAGEARALIADQLRLENQGNLETIEERLFKLRAVARKHRVPVGELAALHGRLQADLATIQTGTEAVEAAKKAAAKAEKDYAAASDILSQKRKDVAVKLDRAIHKELKPLRLEKARFMTDTGQTGEVAGHNSGPFGRDAIMFSVQTNPGAKPGPLMKVASGGELARFLLALKVVLAEKHTAPVLIFDEIDTGVGGAIASAIGERLSRLGQKAQVLAVTHSPQVAAHADAHYRLYKTARNAGENAIVATCAEALDSSGRREEIARMLAGRKVTEEARAAAERLIGSKYDIGQ